MKFLTVTLCALLCAAFAFGCGDCADENKTPEQIKQEVADMDAAAIQKKIDAYAGAIEKKSQELAAETKKLTEIPLTEQMGDEAKKVRASIADLEGSIGKLKKNMEAYAEGLNAKK